MSWNIYVYAEVKRPFSDVWYPLVNSPVLDCFKYYDDDFYDGLDNMPTKDATVDSVKQLANGDVRFNTIKVCSLDNFRSHYNKIVNDYIIKLKSVYSALGTPLFIDDDECYVVESDHEYDEKDSQDYWLKKMTFPVNKELMNDLAMSVISVSRANQMLGVCTSISSMIDYDDKVRLLFVRM